VKNIVLKVFEKKVLRRIFGQKRGVKIRDWKKTAQSGAS
jgi:hypothetical protein